MAKEINIIVAIAKNNVIGKDNKLLWYLSDDLKRFKKYTTNNTVIMGKNTYLSLPERNIKNGKTHALPNRQNIVITDDKNDSFNDVDIVYSIEEAIKKAENNIFIIGGGQIYKSFLPIANKLYLTKIDKNFEGDTFFPEINYSEWLEEYSEKIPKNEKNEYEHTFSILIRKNDYSIKEKKANDILTKQFIKTRGFEIVNDKYRIFKKIEIKLPLRGSRYSAGYDFYSNETIVLNPNDKYLFWTDVKAYMLRREVLKIYIRSSIGIKKDLVLCNQVGIIDSDYYNNEKNDGNIGICLRNLSNQQVIIKKGERIAQGIFESFLESDNCKSEDERKGGIGHTNEK